MTTPKRARQKRLFASIVLLLYGTILCSVQGTFANRVGVALWVMGVFTQVWLIRDGFQRRQRQAPDISARV
jgi:hypothetical protein